MLIKGDRMTFLEETVEGIKEAGQTSENIIFIGSEESGHSCDWETFKDLASFEYDSGYGSPEIAQDLIMVFKNGTKMWRGEDDGSEWWEYSMPRYASSSPFAMPKDTRSITRLQIKKGQVGWCSLAEINKS